MTPGRLDLEVPRNGSDSRILQLVGMDESGAEIPLDLSGYVVSARARDVFGGDYVATATAAIDDPSSGKVSIRFVGAQFDAFGDSSATAIAAWDLKIIGPDGVPEVPLRGIIYISPEATA